MEEMKKLLFVCSGNTCRSPLAKVLAERIFQEEGLEGWEIDSAGTAALHGMSASRQAMSAASALELDLSAHQSKPLTQEAVSRADLILVMTAAHKKVVLSLVPQAAGKVYTVAELAGAAGDIADPFGGSVALYLEVARELQTHLKTIAKLLKANGLPRRESAPGKEAAGRGEVKDENSTGQ